MDNKRLIELLLAKKAGALSDAEWEEMNDLLSNENDNIAAIRHFLEVPLEFGKHNAETSVQDSFENITVRIKARGNKRRLLIYKITIPVAASLLIVFGLSFFYRKVVATALEQNNVVVTQRGSKSNIILPDGTKVWINADTRLTYPSSFNRSNREVFLKGEAYFDVIHDKDHPFIVHTQAMDIKVLGTAFNIRAYQNETVTQTTLIRGSIQATLKEDRDKAIVLKPNEKLIVQNDYQERRQNLSLSKHDLQAQPHIAVKTISINTDDSSVNETNWLKNKLAFDQQTLSTIAPELERWYNVIIKINNPVIGARRVSGVFENKTLEEVLRAIQPIGRFRYSTINGVIIISE